MDFSKALIALKAGCAVRRKAWKSGFALRISGNFYEMVDEHGQSPMAFIPFFRDLDGDDWEIAKFPERMDGESKSAYLLRRAEALRAAGEIGKADKAARLAEACAKAESRENRFFGVVKRAGREWPEAVAAAAMASTNVSAAVSQQDEDVHCEAPCVAKGSAVSAGEVRDEGQPAVKYGLVIEFGSAEALREAMRCQRVEFTVFGMGPPA